jgi:hypothetical protein
MLEVDEVLRGRLMRLQTLIVLESMSSTTLINSDLVAWSGWVGL